MLGRYVLQETENFYGKVKQVLNCSNVCVKHAYEYVIYTVCTVVKSSEECLAL